MHTQVVVHFAGRECLPSNVFFLILAYLLALAEFFSHQSYFFIRHISSVTQMFAFNGIFIQSLVTYADPTPPCVRKAPRGCGSSSAFFFSHQSHTLTLPCSSVCALLCVLLRLWLQQFVTCFRRLFYPYTMCGSSTLVDCLRPLFYPTPFWGKPAKCAHCCPCSLGRGPGRAANCV